MTKISQYSIDQNISGSDKWIGSDSQMQNATKNFTPDKLAKYFNDNQIIDTGAEVRFKYVVLNVGEQRPFGSVTFVPQQGNTVAFSGITSFILSKRNTAGNLVPNFIEFLIDKKILISKTRDINTFGYYNVVSVEEYEPESDFYEVTLEFLDGNGGLTKDVDFIFEFISNAVFTEGYVPYTGATQDVDIGEFGLKTGNVEFDNTPTNTPTRVGSMYWNNADGTVDLILKGGNVKLQVGQESVIRVVNKTATNINLLESNYQAVRVTGAQGQRLKVDLAQATTDNLSAETIGLVTETINNNQEGFITTSGLIRSINTTGSLQGETWNDGDMLYLSPNVAGRVTNIKPQAPNHLIIIGYVVYAHANNGSIFVKVDNGYELDELHNVRITTPLNNQGLVYNSTDSLWENKTIILGTGATSYVPRFTGTTTIGNGSIFDNGTNIGIGTTTLTEKVNIVGRIDIMQGSNNIYVGRSSGTANTTGQSNTAFGVGSMFKNTSGSINLAIGASSLYNNLSGGYNTAIGVNSLFTNTNGSNNVGIGYQSLYLNSSGAGNVSVGYDSMVSNTTGTDNVALGYGTLFNNSTGIGSTAVGKFALYGSTGSYNVGIGMNAALLSSANTNSIVIGYNATGIGSNTVVLGNSSIVTTVLRGSVAVGTTSPNASAILDLTSTTKGFLPPRMTTAQRTSLGVLAAPGLIVYDTDENKHYGWNGISWNAFY